MFRAFKTRNGTSLIEVMVAIGITALLGSMVISYSSGGRKQIILYTETAKLAQIVLKAKAQSVLLYYNPDQPICGYGVKINADGGFYALYRHVLGAGENCDSIDGISDENYKELERFDLPSGVSFEKKSELINAVLFVPPDPKTYIWNANGRVRGEGSMRLVIDDDNFKEVRVNTGGQINY